jgi:predicted metal-dependent peptidase
MGMTWIPSNMPWLPEERRTMGVRIINGHDIQCLYYPPFVDKMSIKELFAVIQHEIEHIVRCHCIRSGHRNPEAWNIAADMTVNGRKTAPRIGYQEPSTNELIVPLKGNIIWIPEDWQHDQTSEFYYDRLEKQQKTPCCGQCGKPLPGKGKDEGKGKGKGKGKGEGEGQGGGSGDGEPAEGQCPQCGQEAGDSYGYGGVSGKVIDDHSTWNQSDVSEDEARQIVKDVVDQATEKCQGHAPSHLEQAIAELAKPVIRWRELIRHYLGKHVGNSRKTYSRRNRRRRVFGMAGVSHHAAATITVIIDTSGSIGSRELEQFFAEIESLSSRAKIFILQWDAAFQGYDPYRRGDWRKLTVKGRGGTDMVGPIDWLIDNSLVPDCTVMLTDGYTGWHEPCPFPLITVITTPEGTTDGPGWGHTVRMKVNE